MVNTSTGALLLLGRLALDVVSRLASLLSLGIVRSEGGTGAVDGEDVEFRCCV